MLASEKCLHDMLLSTAGDDRTQLLETFTRSPEIVNPWTRDGEAGPRVDVR